MSTLGSLALTLADYRKRMAPDGSLDYIIETASQSNPVMKDMVWMEGNLPTGIQTTQRISVPTPSIRIINQGVDATKSATKQITDTCCMLEDRSEVDVKLIGLQRDKEAFRRSEDAAHVEGFGQKIADMLFYGDINSDPDTFNGLLPRYNTLTGGKNSAGYQVVSAGTGGTATNTSAYLIGWGEHSTAGVYPQNTTAGLDMQDLGECDALDGHNKKFRALVTLFDWNVGLTVRDIRQNARLANINTASMPATDATKLALMEKFIYAKNTIRNLEAPGTKFVWYVSDTVYTFLECYLINKNNVHVTRQELMGAMPQIYISGIPVRKLDCIKETEITVA